MALSAYDQRAMQLHACPCCGMDTYNYYNKSARCRVCARAALSGAACPPFPRSGHAYIPRDWSDAT